MNQRTDASGYSASNVFRPDDGGSQLPTARDDCRLCEELVFDDAPFPLCAGCIMAVAGYFERLRVLASDREYDEYRAGKPDDLSDIREYALERLRRKEADAVVYYVSRGDRIKIGTTINLTRRMEAILPDEVLAVEPGGYSTERSRHHQFADLRISGEWFRDDPVLRAHIASVVAEHGEPQFSGRVFI